ncbi:unnamed protein product, partial [Choristocarpus tenellus]
MTGQPAVRAQCLGPYKPPSLSCTIFPSTEGGHSSVGEAGPGGQRGGRDTAGQEELFVDDSGRTAVWRSLGGQVVYSSFRSAVLGKGESEEEGVVQVVRCRFPALQDGQGFEGMEGDGERRPKGPWVVCILRSPDLVTFHYPDGTAYEVTLPCHARLLQPLGEGLLVQRFRDAVDEGGPEGEGLGLSTSNREDGDDPEPVPSLFSLLHPLDELRPVAVLERASCRPLQGTPPSSSMAQEEQELVCDASELVLFARGSGNPKEPTLLLTYHAQHSRHSLWQVLPAPEATRKAGSGSWSNPDPETQARTPDAAGLSTSHVLGRSLCPDNWSNGYSVLGMSGLDPSMSAVAGLSVVDEVLAQHSPRPIAPSNEGGGALQMRGRRVSAGGASWASGGSRNEALANALGLSHSETGVSSPVLALNASSHNMGSGVLKGTLLLGDAG